MIPGYSLVQLDHLVIPVVQIVDLWLWVCTSAGCATRIGAILTRFYQMRYGLPGKMSALLLSCVLVICTPCTANVLARGGGGREEGRAFPISPG